MKQISPRQIARRRSDYTFEALVPKEKTEASWSLDRDLQLASLIMTATLEKLEFLSKEEILEIFKQLEPASRPVSGRDPERAARARAASALQAAARPEKREKTPQKGSTDVGEMGSYKAPQPSHGREE